MELPEIRHFPLSTALVIYDNKNETQVNPPWPYSLHYSGSVIA